MTDEQFEKPCDGNYGDRYSQAFDIAVNHIAVYDKINEYFDDVSKAIESGELDEDSLEFKSKLLSSDKMKEIFHNLTKVGELTPHIAKYVKNPAASLPEEVISEIEEVESILKKDEEMIENVLKLNNLSLEKLGFDSRVLSTPLGFDSRYLSTPQYNPPSQYNSPPQYNSPQQYEAASKNSGCLGVIAVMIVIFLILI